MKCPECQAELPENAVKCKNCGWRFGSEKGPHPDPGGADGKSELKPLSGFRRTLSTELVEKQSELRILETLNDLVESKTFQPGEVMIRKGDTNRDLFFLTEGSVEISAESADGDFVLNEIEPPYILGDIAFLSGFPRTATAKAKTKVTLFIMKYENFMDLSKDFPEWLRPLLTSFASGVKSIHFRMAELRKEIAE
jgi:CRP-like cAMP-binding protein